MKTKLLTLFTFLFFANLHAQIVFEEQVIIDRSSVVNEPSFIFSADLDGDGDMDFVSVASNGEEGEIVWHENIDGQGNFSIPHAISEIFLYEAYTVYATDIDGDGDIDIFAAYEDGEYSKAVWYENLDGFGAFEVSHDIVSFEAGNQFSIIAADLDGDGDMDAITSPGYQNDNIFWFENLDGLGTFGSQQIISDNVGQGNMITTDLDGDGDLDLLKVTYSENKVVWYENLNGLGSFSNENLIAIGIDGGSFVRSGDLDNDGDMDVIVANRVENKIAWFENTNGLGEFGLQQIITSTFDNVLRIEVSDLDNDGDLDVLAGNLSIPSQVVWFENTNGLGVFSEILPINQNLFLVTSIVSADVNGDGYKDIVYSCEDYKIVWNENINGEGVFGEQKFVTSGAVQPRSVFSIDLDGDGDLDVLSGSTADHKVDWYENLDGEGTFGVQQNISSNTALVTFVTSADIDGDGDNDVISNSSNTGTIAWYENMDGFANFSSENAIGENNSDTIHTVDIDGDGDIDILSGSSSGNKLIWHENLDGLGGFGEEQIINNSLSSVYSISSKDLDGDNDMDIVVSSPSDDMIVWFENLDGFGNFGEEQIISNTIDGSKIVIAVDLDGDGDMDILSGSQYDGLTWFENTNGLGNFLFQQTISTDFNNLESIYSEDIDGDGDMDVLSASRNDNKIAWFENTDGIGNFGVQQIISTNALYASSVSAGDLNGDGNMDVLSTSLIDNKVAWYRNLSLASNKINGIVQLDLDSNGCDTADVPMSNLLVVSDNGENTYATFTLDNGVYQLFPPEGNYTTMITSELPNYYASNPDFHTSNFIGNGNIYVGDFCVEPSQTINDLNISLYPLSEARPGFNAYYQLVYRNVGTTILSGNVTLLFDDSKIELLNASETINSQTDNSLTFDFETLYPFETRTIDLVFNVFEPPTTENGNVLQFISSINPISGDNSEEDNTFIFEQIVVGSFDPNDITVLEGHQILIEQADDYLHYLIRFQNTGTSYAIFVNVTNELDSNLDWNTLQIESMSHPNRVEILNGNQVTFIFEAIYLPDSTTDEENSHGFIAYKIKPNDPAALGDEFTNNANIYFDFNPPVITNTVTTTIVEELSVSENELENLLLYPNPSEGIINIQSNSTIISVAIYNQIGQLIVSENNSEGIKTLNLISLTKGLYFVKLKDENSNFSIKKVIKQ